MSVAFAPVGLAVPPMESHFTTHIPTHCTMTAAAKKPEIAPADALTILSSLSQARAPEEGTDEDVVVRVDAGTTPSRNVVSV